MPERKLTDLVQWQELPPALNVVRVPILSPKPRQSLRTVVVCNEYALVSTHFIRQRTTACIGLENGCEGCIQQARTDTKLYFGVWWPELDRLWAAELPHGAIGDVWTTAHRNNGRLRELVLLHSRPSDHKNGKVRAHLRPQTCIEKNEGWRLPREFNLRESLAQVWVNLREIVTPPAPNYEGATRPPREDEIPD